MKREGLILGGIGLVTLGIVIVAALFLSGPVNAPISDNKEQITDKLLLLGPEDERNAQGTSSAKVTIVEYGDYQCPACGIVDPTVKRILKDYKNSIYFVFRNFPLPMHANAQLAAKTALAAGQQNKFWEMHTKLYESQSQWSDKSSSQARELYIEYAKELGLDTQKFINALDQNTGNAKIQKDQDDAYKLGVNSTPTFYINGIKFSSLSYDQFKKEIDILLK